MQNKKQRRRTPRKKGQLRSNSTSEGGKQGQKSPASANKGKLNNEAIKSFNKDEGAGQGKGAQGLEAVGGAAGAGAGKAENQTGNVGEHHGQGTGMGGEEHAPNKHEAENSRQQSQR